MMKLFTLIAAVVLLVPTLGATTITYFTPDNSTVTSCDELPCSTVPVSAMATFTTGADSLTITLQNLLTNEFTVAQGLSDIEFTLDGGTISAALLSSSFSSGSATVAKDGTVTFEAGLNPTGWALDTSAGFDVCLICPVASTARPSQVLIGGLLNPNGSIAGNDPHNPFLTGTATFIVGIPGVTSDTNVTSATFSFGTALGRDVPGTTTPEPASMLLVGLGLIGLGFVRHRR